MKLIFSAGADYEKYCLGLQYGYYYGTKLPKFVVGDLYFADQDWKNPNLERYIKALNKHKPCVATVIDWEDHITFDIIEQWVSLVAQNVKDAIIIIPKINGVLDKIPDVWYGKQIILGYSVPSKYGATPISFEEFFGRRVHLLGGNNNRQIDLFIKYHNYCNIVSIDNNYMLMSANRFGKYWYYESVYPRKSTWGSLKNSGIEKYTDKSYISCVDISLYNYMEYWERLLSGLRNPLYCIEKQGIDITARSDVQVS